MNLTQYWSVLRTELKDPGGASPLWSEDELTRCVHKAVDDLSRFYPLEAIHELTLKFAVTSESWKSGAAHGTYVSLANKLIKPTSETVTNADGTTTYIRDTDYTMDYTNGRITTISTGSMAVDTAHKIGYTKSKIGISIASIIPDLIRVVSVEYPTDMVPQQLVSYNIWNDIMYIGSQRSGASQTELTEGKHLAIYYDGKHTAPGISSEPSYPTFLDEVICIGASSYALFIKSFQYIHQAATDIAYVDIALDKITIEMASVDAELVLAGAVWADEVKHLLTTENIPNMEDWLELGAVVIDVSTILVDAEAALDKIAPEIAAGKGYLTSGEAKIDATHYGDNVPDLYRDYASVQAALGEAYAREAIARIAKATAQQEQAEQYGRYVERAYLMVRTWEQKRADLLTEAARYLDKADAWMGEAGNRIGNAGQYLEIANRFRAEAVEKRNEFWSILRDKAEYRKRISSTPVRQPA